MKCIEYFLVGGIMLLAVTVGLLLGAPAHAFEWPKQIAISSIACIDDNDAVSILLTHKAKDLASAQGRYQELKMESLCLNGSYIGNFVKVAHVVENLNFDGLVMNGYVLEMEQGGHTFFLLVMRKPDAKT